LSEEQRAGVGIFLDRERSAIETSDSHRSIPPEIAAPIFFGKDELAQKASSSSAVLS